MDTSATQTFKITVLKSAKLTSAGPADVWLGHKNSADVGTKFDVKAEVLKNNVVVASARSTACRSATAARRSTRRKAVLKAIQLAAYGLPTSLGAGDTLSLRVSIRIAASGSTHSKATATLWFNIPPSVADNGHLHAKVGGVGREVLPGRAVRAEEERPGRRADAVGRCVRGQERQRQRVRDVRDVDDRRAVGWGGLQAAHSDSLLDVREQRIFARLLADARYARYESAKPAVFRASRTRPW